MTIQLKDDGTITVPYPKRVQREDGIWAKEGSEQVTLRQPDLEELYELWNSLERLEDEIPSPAENGDTTTTATAKGGLARDRVTLERNAAWNRQVIAILGAPQVYVRDEDGEWRVKEGYAEPAWLVSGQIAGQMLRHWQTVPLAPGS